MNLLHCNDGTTDMVCDMGCTEEQKAYVPCENHGGIDQTGGQGANSGGGEVPREPIKSDGCSSGSLGLGGLGVLLKPRCWSNQMKWGAIIGGTLALYYILHKTGSLK
jgi:hypothetical protein